MALGAQAGRRDDGGDPPPDDARADPGDVAGLLTSEEAERAKASVDDLRGRDGDRFAAARDASEDDAGE